MNVLMKVRLKFSCIIMKYTVIWRRVYLHPGRDRLKIFFGNLRRSKNIKFQKNIINAYHKWFLNSSSFNFYFESIIKFIFFMSILFSVRKKKIITKPKISQDLLYCLWLLYLQMIDLKFTALCCSKVQGGYQNPAGFAGKTAIS